MSAVRVNSDTVSWSLLLTWDLPFLFLEAAVVFMYGSTCLSSYLFEDHIPGLHYSL